MNIVRNRKQVTCCEYSHVVTAVPAFAIKGLNNWQLNCRTTI
ncbi:MAG: hypothetical protein ACK55Z_19870 [bacterium]